MVVLRVGGVLTALLGGLLALGQTSLRRTLAFLLISEGGSLFFGVASLSGTGLAGVLYGIVNQALAATLIFTSLGLLEQPDGRTPGVERRDLLRRWPIAGAGLLGGGLALLGLPPMSGFAGKLLIFQAAADRGWGYLLPLTLASALGCAALLRVARERLVGPPEDVPVAAPTLLGEDEIALLGPRRLAPEPQPAALLTVLLLAASLALGVYPQPLLALIGDLARGLTFVRPL
jgi:formate hydrogenlyase subunit 3/multisubunit Na+/H+ antiporter MnhD subunit